MIRKEKYGVEDILLRIGPNTSPIVLDGDPVKVNSLRMQCFKFHGITCVHCGVKGTFFAKEKHHARDKSFHLNLYGIDQFGREILMTRDHIVALAKNGKDILENLQTMCQRCNSLKGSKDTVSESIKAINTVTKKKKLNALLFISPVFFFLILADLPLSSNLHYGSLLMAAIPVVVYMTKLFDRGMNTLLGIKGKPK
jgi:5-methylcytosine-specific restriction endonuclease McrA